VLEGASYQPSSFEQRWQQTWESQDLFAPLEDPSDEPRSRSYVFVPPPFPTGALHMGHVRSYAIADAYARYCRARGDTVLFSIGFDSFGLPAELAAEARGERTADWVARCCDEMSVQLRRLGLSFDWSRVYDTSDPQMYRWTQWLFLLLREQGMVYQATGWTDWCEACDTALASMQVEDGSCWRCHGPVKVVKRTQWYLKVTAYVDENERRMSDPSVPQEADWQASQRTVLGRVDGVELAARADDGRRLTVFTPHREELDSVCCVLISPRHPEVETWIGDEVAPSVEALRKGGWERDERDAANVELVDTGVTLRVEGIDGPLPLLVTPAVDSRYGETAVLCVPAADRTDAVIADRLAGAKAVAAIDRATLAAAARPATRYRIRDFVISRQREWGTLIPIVECPRCGPVPVPRSDLPLGPEEAGRPTPCPQCGSEARRETDTLDCHFDGLWWWMANCVPAADRDDTMFDHPELERWLPGHCLIWGADGGGYVFDQRIFAKVLRDAGIWPWLEDGEPFERALLHEMVRFDGRKMSKHLGNVVEPVALMSTWGADALRLTVLLAASPRRAFVWTEGGLRRSHEFLSKLWDYATTWLGSDERRGDGEGIDTSDPLRRRLAKWCDAAQRRVSEDIESLSLHRAAHNAVELLDKIETFESRVVEQRGSVTDKDHDAIAVAVELLLELVAPFTPHICDELWAMRGDDELATARPWPSGDLALSRTSA
jgi:leucyl-tRNA synthetase